MSIHFLPSGNSSSQSPRQPMMRVRARHGRIPPDLPFLEAEEIVNTGFCLRLSSISA